MSILRCISVKFRNHMNEMMDVLTFLKWTEAETDTALRIPMDAVENLL